MFNIIVPVPSEDEALNLLAWKINQLDWMRENNRPYLADYYKKLNNPIINQMIEDRNIDQKLFCSKYKKLFIDNLYKKELYDEKISKVEAAVLKLQPCYERYENLKKSWGFQFLDKYIIDINLYAVGGSYYKDKQGNGHITIGGGNIEEKEERLPFTIGHEILHLGIEDLIINPENKKEQPVQQEEKERIVDNLCIYTMKGIIPIERTWSDGTISEYQEVSSTAAYMDEIVGTQPGNNLVSAVQQFLKREGRI